MINKEILLEEKSISEIVKQIAKYIIKQILSDIDNTEEYTISSVTYLRYFSNVLHFDLKQWIPSIDDLKLTYTIYTIQNDYNDLRRLTNVSLNCESEYKDGTMTIVSYLINGKCSKDLYESVYHELTHIFQYSNGMSKNEVLYYKIANNKNDNYSQSIGRVLYYTFKSEQDAFAHQFYASLFHNESNVSTYDAAIEHFYYYQDFVKTYQYLMNNIDELTQHLKYFNLTLNKFSDRCIKAKKRWNQKLYNAFRKYKLDKSRTNEDIDFHKIKYHGLTEERYRNEYNGQKYKWGVEPFMCEFNINEERF